MGMSFEYKPVGAAHKMIVVTKGSQPGRPGRS